MVSLQRHILVISTDTTRSSQAFICVKCPFNVRNNIIISNINSTNLLQVFLPELERRTGRSGRNSGSQAKSWGHRRGESTVRPYTSARST